MKLLSTIKKILISLILFKGKVLLKLSALMLESALMIKSGLMRKSAHMMKVLVKRERGFTLFPSIIR